MRTSMDETQTGDKARAAGQQSNFDPLLLSDTDPLPCLNAFYKLFPSVKDGDGPRVYTE